MTFEELKKKHPELNWGEADEIFPEDLEAAAELLEKIAKQERDEHLKKISPEKFDKGIWPTNKPPYGTCLVGYIDTSFENLVKHFGPPNFPGDDYKVSTEWVLEESSGMLITIYDYKETNLYDHLLPSVEQFRRKKFYRWHIGANSSIAVELIRRIIEHE